MRYTKFCTLGCEQHIPYYLIKSEFYLRTSQLINLAVFDVHINMSNRFVATELSIACLLALHYLGEDAGVDSLILCCEQFGSVEVLQVEC